MNDFFQRDRILPRSFSDSEDSALLCMTSVRTNLWSAVASARSALSALPDTKHYQTARHHLELLIDCSDDLLGSAREADEAIRDIPMQEAQDAEDAFHGGYE